MGKRNRERLAAILLAGTLAMTLFGCGQPSSSTSSTTSSKSSSSYDSSGSDTSSGEEPMPTQPVYMSGWMIRDLNETSARDDAFAALELAKKKLDGYNYEGIALIATQLVAGTNYCIFCRKTDAKNAGYYLVYVYQDLSKNADIISEQGILSSKNRTGFVINKDSVYISQDDQMYAMVKDAELSYGANYDFTPFAYLGYYDDGTENFTVLCRISGDTPDTALFYAVVDVMKNEDGSASIVDLRKLPVGE